MGKPLQDITMLDQNATLSRYYIETQLVYSELISCCSLYICLSLLPQLTTRFCTRSIERNNQVKTRIILATNIKIRFISTRVLRQNPPDSSQVSLAPHLSAGYTNGQMWHHAHHCCDYY